MNPNSSDRETGYFTSLNQFIVEKKIGKGQFSEVYRAVSIQDSKCVAIKKIHFYDMVDAVARAECLKEIKLLHKLSHVNIIRYLGSFIANSQLHIVLELAEAGDLGRLIKHCRKKRKLLLEKTIWKYFVQVCAAMNHMHSKRIMHRDIKPANIFMTSDGVIKLGDLGLGRYFSHKTVAAHSMVGTPYYMSPERIQEQGYNLQSDIWSMGCLLYELAALKSPFYGSKLNLYELIQRIEQCRYEPLPSYAFSDTYRDLVTACIKYEPSDRPKIAHVYRISLQMHSQYSTTDDIIRNQNQKDDTNLQHKPYSFGK